MAIIDANNYFTTPGSPYAPTAATDNIAPLTIDTSPLTLPTGSGGASTPGYGGLANANAGRDLGVGGEMWIEVLVTTSVAQAVDSATFKLVTDNTPTIGTIHVLLQSPAFTAAQLAAPTGTNAPGGIPNTGYWRAQLPSSNSYLQYLGLVVTITTTVWTAGAIEGKLLTNIQQSVLYQGGFAVA